MARVLKVLSLFGIVAALATPALAVEGTPEAGQKVFAKCAVCHGIGGKKGAIGPSLDNVIGRTAGTQPEFLAKKAAGYSKAMIAAGAAGQVWTEDEINIYITDPKKKVPGNKMAFPGLKAEQDRANVIAYIKTFSGK